MRGISIALGEIALFLVLAGIIGVAIGFVLRDWLFANRADELDELLRRERAEYRRLEAAGARREHEMKRTIVAREARIEELEAGQAPTSLVLADRPFRPGSIVLPGVDRTRVASGTDVESNPVDAPRAGGTAEDDLQRIRGVGPTIARRLNEVGITTYRQLAALSPEEIGDVADAIRIARGRVVGEDWVGAAAALEAENRGGSH